MLTLRPVSVRAACGDVQKGTVSRTRLINYAHSLSLLPWCSPMHVGDALELNVETGRSLLREGLDDGPGHADMEALRVVDAAAAQAIRYVLIGDEFRHRFLSHALGDRHDRLDDELVDGICAKATNDVTIDLQIVKRKMLQVIERAEA
jgi:hypothetical protein